jgi:hypothetical protein
MSVDRQGRRHNGGLGQFSQEERSAIAQAATDAKKERADGFPKFVMDTEAEWSKRMKDRRFDSLRLKPSTAPR